MTKTSTAELSLIESIPAPAHMSAPAPSIDPDSAHAKPLERCCDAWRRAFKASTEDRDGDSLDKIFAAQDAGEAYCNAMPLLFGYDNIRDFIACTAHGILIGAIPAQKSGPLLYAAQVALSTLNYGPKPRKFASL
jgi:hypothetical protein